MNHYVFEYPNHPQHPDTLHTVMELPAIVEKVDRGGVFGCRVGHVHNPDGSVTFVSTEDGAPLGTMRQVR